VINKSFIYVVHLPRRSSGVWLMAWSRSARYESLSWRQLPSSHNCNVGPGQYPVHGAHHRAGTAVWAQCAETDAVEQQFRRSWAPHQAKLRRQRPQSAAILLQARTEVTKERGGDRRPLSAAIHSRPQSAVLRPQSAMRRPQSAIRGRSEDVAKAGASSPRCENAGESDCARQGCWQRQHLVRDYRPVRRGRRRSTRETAADPRAVGGGLQLRINQAISRRISGVSVAEGGQDRCDTVSRVGAQAGSAGAEGMGRPPPRAAALPRSSPQTRPQSPGATDADLGIYDDNFENESGDDYSEQFDAAVDLGRAPSSPARSALTAGDDSVTDDASYGGEDDAFG
jgi:hypothetical protein